MRKNSNKSEAIKSKHLKMPSKEQIKKAITKISKQKSTIALMQSSDPIDKTKNAICKEIIKYISKNKLSQNELAEKLNVSKARISEICNYRVERYTIDKLLSLYAIINPKVEKLKIAA